MRVNVASLLLLHCVLEDRNEEAIIEKAEQREQEMEKAAQKDMYEDEKAMKDLDARTNEDIVNANKVH